VASTALVLETAEERRVVVTQEVLKPHEIKLDVSTAKIAQPRAWRVQPSHESVSDEAVSGPPIYPVDDRGETAVERTVPDDEGPTLAKVTGRRLSFSIEQVRADRQTSTEDTHTHTHTRTHARTHAHTHTHTRLKAHCLRLPG